MPASATTMTLQQAQDALVVAQQEVIDATASLSSATEAVTSSTVARDAAQTSYSEALAAWTASRVTHPGTTSMASQNVVQNGTFDDASAWSNIGMGSNETILNSNIPRVYNGVLIGSYVYHFVYQPGTFPSPTRQVTFSYSMSNNNTNDGARPQADGYRVEFRTYNAAGQVLSYYDTRNRTDSFPWTNFTATYNLNDDAVRWDVGFRFVDNGYWNGNFAGSIDNVSVVTQVTTMSPETYTYGTDETVAKDSASQILQSAQASLSSAIADKTAAETRFAIATAEVQRLTQLVYDLTPRLASPSNLTIETAGSSIVLSWTAPTPNLSGVTPERYGVFWSTTNFTQNGWGIASTTTSITIPLSTLYSTAPQGSTFQFAIRADNDTLRIYSDRSTHSSVVTVAPPQPEPVATPSPEPTPTPTPQPEPEPSPQPEPSPEPSPVVPVEPEPQPSQTPTIIEPTPIPSEEPVVPDPEPTIPPTEEPAPTPETPEEPVEEPTENVVDEIPDPEPTETPEPTEPELPVTEEESITSAEDLPEELSSEELMQVDLEQIVATELSEAQVEALIEAALETFETAEQGSEEYTQALEALFVAAQADDIVLDEALAAIPLLGDVLGGATELVNFLGNAGADMSPQVREDSEKVVVAAVVAVQAALSAISISGIATTVNIKNGA